MKLWQIKDPEGTPVALVRAKSELAALISFHRKFKDNPRDYYAEQVTLKDNVALLTR